MADQENPRTGAEANGLFPNGNAQALENATARDAALTVLNWAKQHRLFAKAAMEDSVEAVDDEINLPPQKMFSAQAVQEVFRKKPINLVGFNEAEKKVIIFTRTKLTVADMKLVPFQAVPGYSIEYIVGGTADVKGSPPPPQRHYPYEERDGFYTCGSSVFPANCIGAGTLGFLAFKPDGSLYGVTNNHVSGACNNAPPGLPILAPGPLDVSDEHCDPFTIGRHSQLLPINDGIPENIDISVNCDAACFRIADPDRVTSYQGNRYDTPDVVAIPTPGRRVEKIGRTTGHTVGTIVAQAASPVPVNYVVNEYGVRKTVFFNDVFIVHGLSEPFSKPGDSGSLVVQTADDGSQQAVGLVFAGNPRTGESFVLPLQHLLDQLELKIVSGHNV